MPEFRPLNLMLALLIHWKVLISFELKGLAHLFHKELIFQRLPEFSLINPLMTNCVLLVKFLIVHEVFVST